ncbi:MAG: TIGR02466 family protein [Cyanobacteria bacterium J06632_22]
MGLLLLLLMPLDTWFPLGIYYEDLAEAADHKETLLTAVHQLKAAAQVARNFPDMAWTGDLHGVEQIHLDPRFAWVVQQVEIHTVQYLQELGLDLSQVELYIQRAWPVVSQPLQEVGSHSHRTSNISAVYYIAVPDPGGDEAGSLVFFDDARQNEVSPGLGIENTDIIAQWNFLNQDQAVYWPVAGRLMLFPSKQRHAVSINHTDQVRVSLSFDIVMTAAPQAAGSYEFLTPPPAQWRRFEHRPQPDPGGLL